MFSDVYRLASSRPVQELDFAFLVHPRDVRDIHRRLPFLKSTPQWCTTWTTRHLWPIRVAPITGLELPSGELLRGAVIAAATPADLMMQDRELALRRILQAARLAKLYGARYVGLGALTASLSRGGVDVHEQLDLHVATGRMYTVLNISQIVESIVREAGVDRASVRVAVVGAAGSIGAGVSQLLASYGYRQMTLVDLAHKQDQVVSVQQEVSVIDPACRCTITDSFDVLREQMIVVTATNHPDALILDDMLSPGSCVVDDAQPSDVAESLFTAPDKLVLEGGVVQSRNIRVPFPMGLQNRYDIFSCMAELLLMTRHDMGQVSPLGRSLVLDFDLIRDLSTKAAEMGLQHGAFQNQQKLYSKDDVSRVLTLLRQRIV